MILKKLENQKKFVRNTQIFLKIHKNFFVLL